MESIAKYSYARSSAQKIRLLANLIRGIKVKEALKNLNFMKKKSSYFLKKVLMSAIANSKNNNFYNEDYCKIKKIFVNEGPSIKRTMPRAKGRADRILKRTSHITIILSN